MNSNLLNCVPYVLTCQRSCVLTCQRALRAYMLTCQSVLRAYAYMKSTRAGMSLENIYFENSVVHSCIFSYQTEAFNKCYYKLFTIKWFDLSFSKTLTAILSS